MTDEPAASTPAEPLSDPEERLLRQVHPAMIQAGQVGSHAFLPSKEHAFPLSVDRSTLTSAEDAYARHTRTHPSGGVWAVTVGECAEAKLAAYPDPLPDNGAHALVDFRPLGTKARRRAAKMLKRAANERGAVFAVDRGRPE